MYLERAYELARRAAGATWPNPPVGAAIVCDEELVGEGYHHRAGEPHAEVLALRQAGSRARGATLYVSLEPCNHHGRTPPCAPAVIEAGIERVVIGTMDPNPITSGSGAQYLRAHGAIVEVSDDPEGRELIAAFAQSVRSHRPFVTLKLAMSLDGYIASQPGRRQWLTGEESRAYVRELRIANDCVAVGAGTVRIDDPQLTVRPLHRRGRPYVRVIFCERSPIDAGAAVLKRSEGYDPAIVLAPAGARDAFEVLEDMADVLYCGASADRTLDLAQALAALHERGITSVLCEGGPTLAGGLLRARLVDRTEWLVAPRLLRGPQAVPVLAGGALPELRGLRIDRVERLGADVLISGSFHHV